MSYKLTDEQIQVLDFVRFSGGHIRYIPEELFSQAVVDPLFSIDGLLDWCGGEIRLTPDAWGFLWQRSQNKKQ